MIRGLLQIQNHALLAAIEVAEVHGARTVGEPQVARRIAFARRLDLDHLGAVVGELQREVRPRQEQRQVDDAQAFELHFFSGSAATARGRSPSIFTGSVNTRRPRFPGWSMDCTMPLAATKGFSSAWRMLFTGPTGTRPERTFSQSAVAFFRKTSSRIA